MNKRYIAVLSAALIALGASGLAWGEHDDGDDDHHHGGGHESRGAGGRGGLAPVTDERYRTECGGCHFAYQPGLLPAAAWGKIMGTLDQHFGDDATLDPALNRELLTYLQANAAGKNDRPRSNAFAGGASKADGPPRITETVYFTRKHDEVPARYVTGNPKVNSFSNCPACHRGAEQGNFDEHQVDIPGVGAFKD